MLYKPKLKTEEASSHAPPSIYALPDLMGRAMSKAPCLRGACRTNFLRLLILIPVIQLFLVLLFRPVHLESRFSRVPWQHPLPDLSLADPSSAFITTTPKELPDGLGHRLAVINFELLVARTLSVRYIHRVASYDSLTRDDPDAVEKLFGWYGIKDTREALYKSSCNVEYKRTTRCPYVTKYPMCTSLKPSAPFSKLVNIPKEIFDCLPSGRSECWKALKEWSSLYGSNTLFQMQPSLCHEDYGVGNFRHSRSWFRNRYWGYHKTMRSIDRLLKDRVSLDEKRLQVAVHIRRGDFLNVTTSRDIISDFTYHNLTCQVKDAADEEFQLDVPIDIHIFSEGVPKEGRISSHDISIMDPLYVTDKGEAVDPIKHWKKLFQGNCGGDLRVFTHIATDTVQAIRDMVSADVFVGSHSGLTAHVVDVLSRGVSIRPIKKFRTEARMNGEWRLKYIVGKDNSAEVDNAELRRCLHEMRKGGWLEGIELPA